MDRNSAKTVTVRYIINIQLGGEGRGKNLKFRVKVIG